MLLASAPSSAIRRHLLKYCAPISVSDTDRVVRFSSFTPSRSSSSRTICDTRALLASTLLASSAFTALAASPSENKATVEAFILALDNGENLSGMVSSNYTEHQQNSGYTMEGMAGLVPDDASLAIHRAIAGDNMVFLHIEQSGATTLARGDLFRLDGAGNITEHWGGALQVAVPAAETKSGNSMFERVA